MVTERPRQFAAPVIQQGMQEYVGIMLKAQADNRREQQRQKMLDSWRKPGPRKLVSTAGREEELRAVFEEHAGMKKAARDGGISIGRLRRFARQRQRA